MFAIARLVRLLAILVAAVIVVAIVSSARANPANTIVRDIHDAGSWLVGAFKNVFGVKNAETGVAADWGLVAVVYLIVGGLIASLIARMAPTGVHRPSVSPPLSGLRGQAWPPCPAGARARRSGEDALRLE